MSNLVQFPINRVIPENERVTKVLRIMSQTARLRDENERDRARRFEEYRARRIGGNNAR